MAFDAAEEQARAQKRLDATLKVVVAQHLSNPKKEITREDIDALGKSVTAPSQDAKPSAWIVGKSVTVAMPDGSYHFPAGRRIEDPSVARELREAGVPLLPIYETESK